MVLNCERTDCKIFCLLSYRSWKKSGEGGIWTLAPLSTAYSLSRGAPSTTWVLLLSLQTLDLLPMKLGERREWDSNPCALADKRFSRPPRYDHFDISPNDELSLFIRMLGAENSAKKYRRRHQRHWLSYQNDYPMSTIFLKKFQGKNAWKNARISCSFGHFYNSFPVVPHLAVPTFSGLYMDSRTGILQ